MAGAVTNPSGIPEIKPDKFDRAIWFTSHPNIEGGYTVDNGGPTNFGITQSTLDAFSKKRGMPRLAVDQITQDDAKAIARQQYFDEPKLDLLPERVAVAAFDYGFNSGPYQAIKDLQRVVNVKPDGMIGPDTQRAVEKYIQENGEDSLLHNYTERRANLMQQLIQQNPSKYGPNANGWSNRIELLKSYLNFTQAQPQQQTGMA